MNVPKNYSDWVVCFESIKDGTRDEETIKAMEQGTLEWTRGVAERITERLYETIDYRLKRLAEQLQTELERWKGDETSLVKALLTSRRRLAILLRIARLPAFPEQVRESIYHSLVEYAKNAQQSLEDSAQSDRTGRLRILIKNNPLTNFEQVDTTAVPHPQTDGPLNVQKTKRRRIILP